MKHRFVANTGVRVSQLCLGTMPFGGDADRNESAKMYARARDAGINFFDCADIYSQGGAETILGELIDGHRDDVVLASKGYFPTAGGVNARGSSRYHLVRAVEASLRRLKVECIDLYYLHRYDDETGLDETLRALEDLVRSGKILYPAARHESARDNQAS